MEFKKKEGWGFSKAHKTTAKKGKKRKGKELEKKGKKRAGKMLKLPQT